MSDYDVGYGKPPKHAQFKKGVCPNPHGRGKCRELKVAEILNEVLNAKTEFRERGKLKKASRIELSIRRFAALATKGDVASAAWLLKMRAHAKKYGDPGPRSSGSPVGSQRHSADGDSNDRHLGPRSDREWRRQYGPAIGAEVLQRVPCGGSRGWRRSRLRTQLCFDRGNMFQYWRTKLKEA